MRRSTFAEAAAGEGAIALNRVFHEYLVPVTFSSEQLHLHMSYNDVVASASPIWYDDAGKVLAAALLAIRGKRGWIGGFGVAPEYRSKGYASELLASIKDIARERGVNSIALEVLIENTAAIRTYERGGFRIERELRSFRRITESSPAPLGFTSAPPEELIDEPDPVRPCWQRERATLRNGAVSSGVSDMRGNYALFRYNADIAQVLKLRAGNAAELALLTDAVARSRARTVFILNEPLESHITQIARSNGWDEPLLQYEMTLSW